MELFRVLSFGVTKGFRVFSIAALLMLANFSVIADETGKEHVHEMSEAHNKNVEQMLVLINMPAQVNAAADNFKQIYSARVNENNSDPNVEKVINAYRLDLSRLVDSVLGWESIKQNYVNVYSKMLTADEVEAITGFFKSPAGIKFASSQASASGELIKITEHLVEADLALPLKQLSTKLGEALTSLKAIKLQNAKK